MPNTPHSWKYAFFKGLFITGLIIVLSFSVSYAVYTIQVYREQVAKRDAFLMAGINVSYEGRTAHIAPLNFDTFARQVQDSLALPFQMKKSAELQFVKGAYKVAPEIVGQELDQVKLLEDARGRLRTFSKVAIVATIRADQPDIIAAQINEVLPDIRKKFEQTMSLTSSTATDLSFTLRLRDHLNWITFHDVSDPACVVNIQTEVGKDPVVSCIGLGKSRFMFSIQPEPFVAYVNQDWVKATDRVPTAVKITRTPQKITFSDKGKNGRKLNVATLLARLTAALQTAAKKIELPIDEEKFTVDIAPDLQALGIKDVLSVGHTSYYRSPPNRIHNISVGLAKFNGVLVAPGEIFSFVKELGPVDGPNGFLKELVIKPEGVVPDFGGGLCQVSTTAYRAALYAGLPIVERSPHSFAVGYYSQIGGHGIDATIYPGSHDLRFKNDTPNYMLMQSYDDGLEAYFIFYGTSDGRTVTLEGPEISNRHSEAGVDYVKTTEVAPGAQRQVERAQAGFDTLWHRYITLPGGLTQKEDIFSRYVSTHDEILVGVTAEELAKNKLDGIAIKTSTPPPVAPVPPTALTISPKSKP